jgi:glutaredoxin
MGSPWCICMDHLVTMYFTQGCVFSVLASRVLHPHSRVTISPNITEVVSESHSRIARSLTVASLGRSQSHRPFLQSPRTVSSHRPVPFLQSPRTVSPQSHRPVPFLQSPRTVSPASHISKKYGGHNFPEGGHRSISLDTHSSQEMAKRLPCFVCHGLLQHGNGSHMLAVDSDHPLEQQHRRAQHQVFVGQDPNSQTP